MATPNNVLAMTHMSQFDGSGITVEERRRKIAAEQPQKRLIEASEIAATAAFLCCDEAFGITGEDITIAGGALW